jgi:hypothetical protein
LAPISIRDFANDCWAKRSLYIPGQPDKFQGFFDLSQFRAALALARTATFPNRFRLRALVPDRELGSLTFSEVIEPDDVQSALDQGLTVCVNDIGAGDRRLRSFAGRAKQQLGLIGHARFNCYVSPDGSGARVHLDARASFTMQISGSKRWRFSREPVVPWPLGNAQVDDDGVPTWVGIGAGLQAWEALPARIDSSTFDQVILSPGDVLCLPAGMWHTTEAIGASLALNLVLEPLGFIAVLSRILEIQQLSQEPWRGALPLFCEDQGAALPPALRTFLAARMSELGRLAQQFDPEQPAIEQLLQNMRLEP